MPSKSLVDRLCSNPRLTSGFHFERIAGSVLSATCTALLEIAGELVSLYLTIHFHEVQEINLYLICSFYLIYQH